MFGDYESLESGKARDALEDMMGGVGEGVVLKDVLTDAKQRDQFWKDLEQAFENNSLISASVVVYPFKKLKVNCEKEAVYLVFLLFIYVYSCYFHMLVMHNLETVK